METPSWFEPLKELIQKIADIFFGKEESVKVTVSRLPLLGDRGEHVKTLQIQLNNHGAGLMLDGDFGPKTQKAVSVFQKSKGLAGSGVIGPKTLEFLGIELVIPESGELHGKIWAIVQKELGQKEISGSKHNPRILQYHATTGGFGDDETPWCSSFVNWVLKEAGINGTNSAAARSWMNWGVATSKPKKGDIAVFWRGKPNGWQGHTAFYSHETPTHVYVTGGNQNNVVNTSPYSKKQLLGYRTYQ